MNFIYLWKIDLTTRISGKYEFMQESQESSMEKFDSSNYVSDFYTDSSCSVATRIYNTSAYLNILFYYKFTQRIKRRTLLLDPFDPF